VRVTVVRVAAQEDLALVLQLPGLVQLTKVMAVVMEHQTMSHLLAVVVAAVLIKLVSIVRVQLAAMVEMVFRQASRVQVLRVQAAAAVLLTLEKVLALVVRAVVVTQFRAVLVQQEQPIRVVVVEAAQTTAV
jgi:hypothetical protein